jgi:gliding motility-associated-like protein
MMKKLLLFLLVLGYFSNASLAQNIEWAQRIGNVKSDKITSIKTDGLGYIYIAGYFSTSLTIGTNNLVLNYAYNSTSKEAFIAKLDSTGYCYWAKAGGGYYDDRVLGMDVDSAGYSVITGTYWEGVGFSFPPNAIDGSAWGNSDQCFIAKFDPNGNYMWGTYVCGDDVTPSGGNYRDDQGFDVAMDKVGNIYVTGFMTTVTLYCGGNAVTATNPNTSQHKHCYWLAKFNAAGVPQWAKTFGKLPWDAAAGKYIERDIALCVDEKDGIYVTGGFDSTRQFGPQTLTTLGGYDVFLLKYDSNGVFQWVSKAGSDKDDWANGICSDKNGHIYFTGEHRDSLIMDTVIVKNYDKRDAFLFKVDAQTGKPIWGKRAGSDFGGERGNDVWADDKCNVYLVGDINEGAKFGNDIVTPINGEGVQSFMARITPEGKWTWAITAGGLGDDDRANAVAKGKGHQVYMAGYFRQTVQYGNTTLVSAASSDGVFARIYDSMLNRGTPFVLTPPTKTVLCFGDTAHLNIPKHGFLQMNPTNGVTFNTDSTLLIFAPNTTTTYTIIGASDGQCPEFDTITFTLSVGLQGFTFTPLTDTIVCAGETISHPIATHDNLIISPTIGASINTGQTAIDFSPSTTTTYTLTGYSLGVCPSYDTLIVTILVGASPHADFELTPNIILIQNPTFNLTNKSTGANYYKWYKGNNVLFSNSTNPTVTESEAGNYCYKLVAETLDECKDSINRCGDIIKDERVIFPNAFTPNGDLNNDEFKPLLVNMNLSDVKDFSFIIANRYGQIVYQSKDPYFGWDGRWKGNVCDMGTYYYHCKFISPNGKAHEIKGDVILMY